MSPPWRLPRGGEGEVRGHAGDDGKRIRACAGTSVIPCLQPPSYHTWSKLSSTKKTALKRRESP